MCNRTGLCPQPIILTVWLVIIMGWIVDVGAASSRGLGQQDDSEDRIEMLHSARRILFLGNSITYAGDYVCHFEAWMQSLDTDHKPRIFNMGLPSETVSGLSEAGHAGGKFPRPDLIERLDRVLELTKPDLVFACYGINCGIYQPFDEERFRAFQDGIRSLDQKVQQVGATMILITPPSFDDQRSNREFSYNDVLGRYSSWLVEQRQQGWHVIDLHSAMTNELQRIRRTDPEFTFQPDAVHPNAAGHWFMASRLIHWFGDEKAAAQQTSDSMLEASGLPLEVSAIVQERMKLIRDAYLDRAGHQRPGIQRGLPIDQAETEAEQLSQQLEELLDRGLQPRPLAPAGHCQGKPLPGIPTVRDSDPPQGG